MKRFSPRSFLIPLVGLFTFSIGTITATLLPINWVSKSTLPAMGTEQRPPATDPATSNDGPNNLGCWGDQKDHPKFGPIRLPHNHILTTICGTLFVKDSDGEIVWKHTVNAPLTDSPKLIDAELVVVGLDLHLLALDPSTGERLWVTNSNGRAFYSAMVPFVGDVYAILVDMTDYENCRPELAGGSASGECVRQYPDRVQLRRRDELLREWDVPARSRIEVSGGKLFAVYRRGKTYKRIELHH